MPDRLDPPEPDPPGPAAVVPRVEQVYADTDDDGSGLRVRGKVRRRWRKVLDSGTEVVYYDVSGITIQVYRPRGYFPIGCGVDVRVNVSCYQSKAGIRYSLVQASGEMEGQF